MDKIIIHDLEVFYRVGVADEERAMPQRLLLCVAMMRDLSPAVGSDDLTRTIDYFAVTQRLLGFGQGQSWKLLEKLAGDVAGMLLNEFAAGTVSVTVKKFVIPEASYVAVELMRSSGAEKSRSK